MTSYSLADLIRHLKIGWDFIMQFLYHVTAVGHHKLSDKGQGSQTQDSGH